MKYLAALVCLALLTACFTNETPNTPLTAAKPQPIAEATALSCGGMNVDASGTCSGENEYCHRTIKDMCGAADARGVCREKPQMCTMDYRPVCGCDGQTYPNECAANSKGVSAAYAGDCRP